MSITVLIADDHKLVRDGLRILINRQDDMEVAGEAQDGNEAVRLAKKLRPDVVIMDISMPGLDGIEATRRILKENQTIKVIALSMHSDRMFVKGMMDAGASGYLLKDCAFEELAKAIRCVINDKVFMSSGISN